MTLYAGESAWFVVPAFIVVVLVIIHEIRTRRAGKRRGLPKIEDRPTESD